MKKKFFIILFIALLNGALFAQNGYKDFYWGMSFDEVKAKCSDLELENESVFYWETYFYSDELKSLLNPLLYETEEKDQYYSSSSDISFYFIGGKVRGVSLGFAFQNIHGALIQKYGQSKSVNIRIATNAFAETCSWDDKGRIIVWSSDFINNKATGIEKVCYIDDEWITPLLEKSKSEIIKLMNNQKSRLD